MTAPACAWSMARLAASGYRASTTAVRGPCRYVEAFLARSRVACSCLGCVQCDSSSELVHADASCLNEPDIRVATRRQLQYVRR